MLNTSGRPPRSPASTRPTRTSSARPWPRGSTIRAVGSKPCTRPGPPGGTPFLRALLDRGRAEWAAFARRSLEHPEYPWGVFELVLTHPDTSPDLLDAALARLQVDHAYPIRELVLGGRLAESTLLRLLTHDDPAVAFLAAAGEWQSDPSQSVRDTLKEAWTEAILGRRPDGVDEYLLCKILESDPDLTLSWLSRRIGREPFVRDVSRRTISVVARRLDAAGRRKLLALIPEDHWDPHLIAEAVGDDLEIYREFLREGRWRDHWSLPLEHWTWEDREEGSIDDPAWLAKARLALEAGKDPAEVARLRFLGPVSCSIPRSVVWQSWIDHFGEVERSGDARLAPMAREIIRIARERREVDLRGEANEEVYGR